jgi:hypothetical protein
MRSGSVVAAVLALLATALAAAACFMFPLTASPGPESAQVLAVVGGLSLALMQAARAARRQGDGFLADLVGGLLVGAGMLTIFLAVTAVGGAARPSCNPARGFSAFFFLALPVLVVHSALGTWVGRLVGKPGRAALVTLLLEIGLALWLFIDWYREPSFRVASHAFVVIDGDLLRGATMPAVLVAFRAATLMFGTALILLGAARYPRIRRASLSSSKLSLAPLYALALAAFIIGGAVHVMSIDVLKPARQEMELSYSLTKKRGPLVIHADPLAVRPKDVDAMLAEGTLWISRIALRLGVRPSEDIHIWLHATRDAQAHWTGASHVDFTLPWRHELHVVGADVPHGTLGHELAHAVAAELSPTLLKMPSAFVLFEQAAVVEGVAVALTPELSMRDGLTVKEQAAAMKEAGFAPETMHLFDGLRFFTEPPARAYIAAGAFIGESLVAKSLTDPSAALSALYRTGSVADVVGGDAAAAELARAHDAMLDGVQLPPDAAAVAWKRFKQPSILRAVCEPDDVERVRSLRARLRTGDVDSVLSDVDLLVSDTATLDELLKDATEVEDAEAIVGIGSRLERLAEGADLARRTDDHAMALWLANRRRDAMATWDRVEVESLPVDLQRNLLAERALAENIVRNGGRAPVAGAALDVLLPATAAGRAAAFARLHYWIGVDDGSPADLRIEPRAGVSMARYIHARRLVRTGALDDGAAQFRRLLNPSSSAEALPGIILEQVALGLASALAGSGQAREASTILIDAADAVERPAMRLMMRDGAERAARAAAAPKRPARITADSDPAWADRLLLGIDEGAL